MKKIFLTLVLSSSMLIAQEKVIFDTDMNGDVDDVGALALLHALADNGEAEILACMTSNPGEYVCEAVDVINTYYNRPDIPIGALRGTNSPGSYTKQLAENYPHDAKREDLPEPVELYRQILAEQPDSSVTIITVGFLPNIGMLLKSEADEFSDLNGIELCAQKVKTWVCMGGTFPNAEIKIEYNLSNRFVEEAKYAIDNWPNTLIFTGWEIGKEINTGQYVHKYLNNSPVKRAYQLFYCGFAYDGEPYFAYPHGHYSWDQTAVWIAVNGTTDLWNEVNEGYCAIRKDGYNEWKSEPDKDHVYITPLLPHDVVAAKLDSLMNQPPLGAHFYPNSRVGWLPFEAEFDAGMSNPGLNATITDFNWNFGDGHTANGENVSHLYENAGSYKVDLTITTDKGDTFSRSDSIVVYDPNFSAVEYYGSALAFERIQENLWSTRMDNDNLTYYLNNGERDNDVDFSGFCFVKDTVFSDFTLTYTARTGEDLSENRSPGYRIMFGVQDAENYTYIDMRKSGGRMMHFVDGERSSLARLSSAMPDDQYHTVTIVKQGDALNVFSDGELLVSYTGPEMQVEGKLGFGSRSDAMYFDDIMISHQGTHVAQSKTNLPHTFELMQNYPNPFNPSTTINYAVPNETQVQLFVYDIRGRLVETLVNARHMPGRYAVQFNAAHLPSGTYLYKLTAGTLSQTRPMLFLR